MNAHRVVCILLISWAVALSAGCRLDSLAQFDEQGPNPLAFTTVDVFGREVSVGLPSDEVVVLFFNGEATSDAMQPITTEIAVAFREERGLDFVNVVDLRSLSFYERPFAPGALREASERTVARTNHRLEERGLPPIEGLGDAMFLIADNNGWITEQYGVPDPNEVITCIVFELSGGELGRFDPSTQLDQVIAAIERSLDGRGPVASDE